MNRINQLFNSKHHDILSIYFCAGTPQPDGTANVIRALEQGGVDMIEIGIPFSDPMADGPTIQQAATDALRGGMSLKKLFAQLADIRRDVHIPLILMGYLNPIMQFGFERFCQACNECGIDGMIIPDLPYREYMESYRQTTLAHDLRFISLITPETEPERIRLIDRNAEGFIYMVSSASTTGAQQSFDEQKQAYFRRINAMHLSTPRMIGFGISNVPTYQAAAANASGVIIGSRFVTLLAETGDPAQAIARLKHDIGRD